MHCTSRHCYIVREAPLRSAVVCANCRTCVDTTKVVADSTQQGHTTLADKTHGKTHDMMEKKPGQLMYNHAQITTWCRPSRSPLKHAVLLECKTEHAAQHDHSTLYTHMCTLTSSRQ